MIGFHISSFAFRHEPSEGYDRPDAFHARVTIFSAAISSLRFSLYFDYIIYHSLRLRHTFHPDMHDQFSLLFVTFFSEGH